MTILCIRTFPARSGNQDDNYTTEEKKKKREALKG